MIPTQEEVLGYIDAVMDPGNLRVLQHLAEERLTLVAEQRPLHERPLASIDVAGENAAGVRRELAAATREEDTGVKNKRKKNA